MKTSTITINSLDISYRQTGETGPSVLFVHGLSMSSEVFSKQLESSLADSYRLIALDLPGHGHSSHSDNPESDYSLRGYAETVAAFAGEVGAEEALFAGWSLGGHILLEASDLLTRAKGFLIFGTPPVSISSQIQKKITGNPIGPSLYKGEISDDERKRIIKEYFHPDYNEIPHLFLEDHRHTDKRAREVIGEAVRTGTARDEVDIVEHLAVPLAILQGEGDLFTDLSYLKSLNYANLYTNDVIIVPEAGHAPQWEAPDTFNSLVIDFMDAITQC